VVMGRPPGMQQPSVGILEQDNDIGVDHDNVWRQATGTMYKCPSAVKTTNTSKVPARRSSHLAWCRSSPGARRASANNPARWRRRE
jgi:hypothetical protein